MRKGEERKKGAAGQGTDGRGRSRGQLERAGAGNMPSKGVLGAMCKEMGAGAGAGARRIGRGDKGAACSWDLGGSRKEMGGGVRMPRRKS